MDKYLNLAIASAFVLVVITVMYVVTMLLTKKYGKEKVDESIQKVKEGLEKADTMVDNLSVILPQPVINIADSIIRYAYVIVAAVEQGYKNGSIEKEIRKDTAMTKMTQILKLAGIDVTDEMTPVIDDAVEAAVSNLPKTHPVMETKTKKS